MTIAGLDIGTTGCKCSLYHADGTFLCEAYREYPASSRQGGELHPATVWRCVKETLAQVAPKAGQLQAVGVTSFGESVVLADQTGEPLCASMLYTDPRGIDQCRALTASLGEDRLAGITGLQPHSMYSISKLIWLRENRPELYEQAKRIFLFQDFVVFRLCGAAQIDDSLASRTMAFNIRTRTWSDPVLQAAGVDKSRLSAPVRTGAAAGALSAALADELGLPPGVLVVSGCHDQVAASIGCGVLTPGMAVDGTGTVECITPLFQGIPNETALRAGSYAIVPHVREGRYVCYAFSFTGGALLKWFRDQLCQGLPLDYPQLDGQVGDTPSGLLVLPHFEGAATPYMDNHAQGAVVGLTTRTSRIHIYRALMEGVTYEMRLNIERLAQAGIPITELRATGGGALSPAWLQIKADVLGVPIVSMGAAQSGTLGSVMLAGVACGLYTSLEEASQVFVRRGREYHPRQTHRAQYLELYERYRRMYPAVRHINFGETL